MTSTLDPKPVHSENPACTMPSISTRNLKFLNGSTLAIRILLSFRDRSRLTAGDLLYAEDHELSRPHDRHADFGHNLPQISQLRWIGIEVAFNEERLLGCRSEQRARVVLIQQEVAHRSDDALP